MWALISTIIVSVLVIMILHHFFYYIRDTFTVKKTKDLVEIQTHKYKSIVNDIMSNNSNNTPDLIDEIQYDSGVIDYNSMASKLENLVLHEIERC